MTTTAEQTWEQKAIDNFKRNFWSLIGVNKQYLELNRAEKALDETFGYTGRYGDADYVNYQDRDEKYRTILNSLQSQMDSLNDQQTDSLYAVNHVLTILPYTVQQQIIGIVEEALTKLPE